MQTNRRDFILKAGTLSAGLGLFPASFRASALDREDHVPPNSKITMVLIGCGSQGRNNLRQFLRINEVRVTAICDVDSNQSATVKQMVDEHYGDTSCRVYKDYRELLEKEQADTAVISLPDHWHALVSCAVADKKTHIYGEKPLARYLSESRAIVDAVHRNNIVWQTGSQQRSDHLFHRAAELVRNGRIGKISYVEVGLPNGGSYIGNPPVQPVPQGVDWDMWLGPAPKVQFRGVLHWNWRWIMDYSGGQLTDWAGHHIDIAHWSLGLDHSGPVTIEGSGRPNNDGIYNVPVEYDFMCVYDNGFEMRIANQSKLEHGMGTFWKGTSGWIHVTRGGLKASNENILKEKIGRDEIPLYKSTDHHQNFIDCVKSRKVPIAPAEAGHRAISVAHLGEIAMATGQKLHWDPQTEKFTDNNIYASRLLQKPYTSPWIFPGQNRF
jgi:predicted dehydrogenase